MPGFNKTQIIDLKNFLNAWDVSYGELKDVLYDGEQKLLRMIIVDPESDEKNEITFFEVVDMFFVNGEGIGEYNRISALTVEEGCSGMQLSDEDIAGSLCLVLRCSSGDEFRVVAKRVSVDVK